MLNNDLIRQVETKVLEVYELAQIKFGRTFELPQISFELGGKRTAGVANSYRNQIVINPKFLIEFPEQILSRTVGHEIAHLLTDTLYPRAKRHHGPEWKYVARSINIEDTRCHSMILSEVKNKGFQYKCPCHTYWLSSIKHRRAQYGTNYCCPTCKQKIVWVGR
jgi:SprT protein